MTVPSNTGDICKNNGRSEHTSRTNPGGIGVFLPFTPTACSNIISESNLSLELGVESCSQKESRFLFV
jgi:hypothetical protein